MAYTIEAANEWSTGQSVNGTGRRAKVSGYYVIAVKTGRRVRAFTGNDAEAKAKAWAIFCGEHFDGR